MSRGGGSLHHNMAEMEGRTCLGCRLGRFATERHWRSLTPRHAPQAGLRAHLVAKSFRTLTKKPGTAKAIPDFLEMAKGLGLGYRLGCCSPVGRAQHRPRREPRPARQSATGGQRPSARGFGVDVGTHQRERRRGGVARSPRSSPQRAVLIWCYEESEVEKACRAISFSSPTTISFCLHRATGVGNEITTC